MEPLFLYLLTMPAAGSCSAKGCVFVKNAYWKRLLSFFLCFVFLFSIVPFRAHAVGVDWVASQVGIDIAVAGILEGLGVFRDSASDYFGELISEVKGFLNSTGQAAGDVLDVYWKIDPLQQNPLLTIPLSAVLAVRNYLFDNHIVSDFEQSFSHTVSFSGYTFSANYPFDVVTFSYYQTGYASGSYIGVVSKSSGYVSVTDPSGSTTRTNVNSFSSANGYYRALVISAVPDSFSYNYFGSFRYPSPSSALSVVDNYINTNKGKVFTKNNVLLGQIYPNTIQFSSAYQQWLTHERELSSGSVETMVQIGLGQTLEETEDLTQEQIWAGLGSIQIPEQDQTQGTLQDILQGIIQLPTQIVGSIQTALHSFFQISGEATDYVVQLRDFFPFCIPFDLFDFITVLSAEPEAPVFHWEIPVPQLGQTFELEVDLSAWDDIAVLFRNLELLAFIFGLAIMTREKFLRS